MPQSCHSQPSQTRWCAGSAMGSTPCDVALTVRRRAEYDCRRLRRLPAQSTTGATNGVFVAKARGSRWSRGGRGVKGYTMLHHATACYSMLHVSFICTRVVSQSSSLEGSRSSLDTSFFCCSSRMKQFMGITPLPSFSIRKLSSNLQTISLSSDVLCAL